MAAKGMKANKAVIFFALATVLFCVVSLSLKTTVLADSWQSTVGKLVTYNSSEKPLGDLDDPASLGGSKGGSEETDFEKAIKEKIKAKAKVRPGAKVADSGSKAKPRKGGDTNKAKGGDAVKKEKAAEQGQKQGKPSATTSSGPPAPSAAAQKAAAQKAKKEEAARKDAEAVKKNKAQVLEKFSKVKPAAKPPTKGAKDGPAAPKLRTAKGKIVNALAAYGSKSERIEYKCGNMPESMWPKFTEQKIKKGGSRRYIAKTGYVSPMNVHKKITRAKTENGPRRGRIERSTGRLKKGEQPLIKCLNHLGKCDNASTEAARSLDGMGTLLATRNTMIKKTYKRCALVGNSGAMKEKKYGKYIDSHDFVARVNALPTRRFEDNLGNKTSLRVMSFKISKDVCCFKKDYKPDNKQLQFLIWFPASRSDILKQLRKRYPTNPSSVMPTPFLSTAVNVFKQLRKDLLRLGYGPFEEWEYMTSGMHALLGLVQSCHVVNLYGFTTDVSTKGPYWFTGRRQPPRSGRTQHAWDHERMVLRSLYAAGLINICTP